MTTEFSENDLFVLYGDLIKEMLPEWTTRDPKPRSALDFSLALAAVNVERERLGQELLPLPTALHRQINEYARNGMYKGGGRRHPNDSHLTTQFKEAALSDVAAHARKRKQERLNNARVLLEQAACTESFATRGKLMKQAEEEGIAATGANSAEDKAIEDAREYDRQHYGCDFSVSAIRIAMAPSRD